MDSSNDADLKPETTNQVNIDDFKSGDGGDDSQMTLGDKLCEDELTVIFSNSWISPQDLLNLRLVSKSWRDAATATLLRRDALVVELSEDSNRAPRCFYKNRQGKKTDENKLSQLTDLISKSKKFPSTNFRIQTSPDTFTPYTEFLDLMNLFKLHGDKIKTIRPQGWITRQCLLDILLIYAPTLENLDLSEARITALSEENALEWTSKTLSVESLTIRDFYPDYCEYPRNCYEELDFVSNNVTGRDLVHLLLSSPSKLNCIENVTLETLEIILTEEKGHLIRSFHFKLYDAHQDSALGLVTNKFSALNPTLSKVVLDLECDNLPLATCITSVNRFIQSFKDTVQNVSLSFSYIKLPWDELLRIPPMKKLKSLTLTITDTSQNWIRCDCDEISICEVCAQDIETNVDLRGTVFQFEDGISAQKYFPSLIEVSLNSNQLSGDPDVSLMNFFSFKSDTNGYSSANWNCLPQVDILSFNKIDSKSEPILQETCQSSAESLLISQVFPNIRILKFRCGEVYHLSDALWASISNVEFIEIDGIRSFSSDLKMSHYVDKAFTGFDDQMLENLKRSAAELSCEGDDDLEQVKYAPERPSICDLRHLRELKLKFVGEWSSEFASSVTGLHTFSKMPNTKFIISYDPETVLSFNRGRAKFDYSNHSNDDEGDDSAESNEGSIQVSDDANDEDEKAGQGNNGGGGNDDGGNEIVENSNDENDCKENGDDVIAKFEELVFGAIRPYVHIVHEKQKYGDWWDF